MDIDTSIRSTNSNRSGTSDANSVSSARRIMKIRTYNESLRKQTDAEREMARIRRCLRLSGLSHDDDVDLSTVDSNPMLSVTFNTVEVREYPIILGDNPAVSEGPPLTIDWAHSDVDEFGVEEYETTRPPRRGTLEMNIPSNIRVECLKRCGYTTKDIMRRVQEVSVVKQRRLETTTMLYRSDMNESVEKAKRRFTNIFSQKKKKERALMKASMKSMAIERAESNLQAEIEEEALAAIVCENNGAS